MKDYCIEVKLFLCASRDDAEFDIEHPDSGTSRVAQALNFKVANESAFEALIDEISQKTYSWSDAVEFMRGESEFFIHRHYIHPDYEGRTGYVFIVRHSEDWRGNA